MRFVVFALLPLAACSTRDVPGADGGGPDAAPSPDVVAVDAPPAAKRVFVTSLRYPADLVAAGGQATGVASGDALCQQHADAVSLGGTFRAWLSSTAEDAIDHVQGTGPWYRLDGRMAFANHASLGTTPMVPIAIDETGGLPDPFYEVWTGTATGGRRKVQTGLASTTCNDWTTAELHAPIGGWLGLFGPEATGPEWTNFKDGYCGPLTRHLYCFEQ